MKMRLLGLVAALFVLTGCSDISIKDQYLGFFSPEDQPVSAEEDAATTLTELRVPVDINDSLHPYLAVGENNLALMPLLYDPLVKLDEEYRPIPWLAQSMEMQGTRWVVRLREGVTFSSGAAVTGADVEASYKKVTALPNRYPQLVDLVTDCTVNGNTITFTLHREDQNFPGLLSFPILPASAGEEAGVPGTGRYQFADSQLETLTANTNHWSGSGVIQTIHLVEIPDEESLTYSLKTGVVDYLFTNLNQPESYSIGTAGQMVELGNLIYIGLNQETPLLGNANFRRTIEPYFSRSQMSSRVYSNRASEAYTPFAPSFYQLPQDLSPVTKTKDELEMALSSLGLTELDEGNYALYEGERVVFRLIYNSENLYRAPLAQEIQSDLYNCGIQVELVPLTFQGYQQALSAGNYDLYIGEVKLGDNMDLTPLLSGASLGVTNSVFDLNLINRYREYQSGSISCEEFLADFTASQPVIPLLYRRGMVAWSHTFSNRIIATQQDIFYNIAGW